MFEEAPRRMAHSMSVARAPAAASGYVWPWAHDARRATSRQYRGSGRRNGVRARDGHPRVSLVMADSVRHDCKRGAVLQVADARTDKSVSGLGHTARERRTRSDAVQGRGSVGCGAGAAGTRVVQPATFCRATHTPCRLSPAGTVARATLVVVHTVCGTRTTRTRHS